MIISMTSMCMVAIEFDLKSDELWTWKSSPRDHIHSDSIIQDHHIS